MKPILSLCIPTNGISEWVFPVLDSIYIQNVDPSVYEVIVTNNGNNDEFHQRMLEYEANHNNLVYKKTEAYMFHNQLEALKLAKGEYLKLLNHRGIMKENSINKMIEIIKNNIVDKPVLFFSNGVLDRDIYDLTSFDSFVRKLGRYASWTTGVGIWSEDYRRIPHDIKIDKISPHSCILFSERKKNKYIIYNYVFSKEIESDDSKKGSYDLFKAFGVEELSITQNLFIDGDITADTLKAVKKDYKRFLSELYLAFCIKKKPCSYDLSGFDDAMGIYFSKTEIVFYAYYYAFRNILCKLRRINK